MRHEPPIAVADFEQRSDLTGENIRCGYLVQLPYRIRIGTLRHFAVETNQQFDVWLHNRVDLPTGTGTEAIVIGGKAKCYEEAFTDVFVSPRKPVIPDDISGWLKNWASQEFRIGPRGVMQNVQPCIDALNEFLIGYFAVVGRVEAGHPLRRLSYLDFSAACVEIVLIQPAGFVPLDGHLLELFARLPERKSQSTGFVGAFDDIPSSQIALIPRGIQRHKTFIFYEQAFEAYSRLFRLDSTSALIYMVVAFEAAHAAFLNLALQDKLQHLTEHQIEGVVSTLLREHGISAIYQITPYLFMDEHEMPSQGDLEACQEGITLRNDMMHSIRKKGQYNLRKKSNRTITAFMAVESVYKKYVFAIERRLESRSQ